MNNVGNVANKRIGFVVSSPPKYSETFLLSKYNGLVESGYDVFVFGLKHDNINLKKNIKFKYKKGPYLSSLNLLNYILISFKFVSILIKKPKQLFKFIELERKDGKSRQKILKTIYFNSNILKCSLDFLHFSFLTIALEKENLANALDAKMSASIRGYDIGVYPLKNPGCYYSVWKKLDRLHYISEGIFELAIKNGFSNLNSAFKITPAVDTTGLIFKKDKFFEFAEIRILTVGRLTWIKDYSTIFNALAILKRCGLKFIYDIVGDGDDFEHLIFLRQHLNLEFEINFLGKVDFNELKLEFHKYDFYLQSSLQEGFCNSVLEAQAAGIICIVSDAIGLSENVINGYTGWTVPIGNSKAFAKKILEVLDMPPSFLSQIAKNAHERVRKEFNLEKQKELFSDFFNY
jgi:colanic acid/amylovoran biosynthesis glycosyltransferase